MTGLLVIRGAVLAMLPSYIAMAFATLLVMGLWRLAGL